MLNMITKFDFLLPRNRLFRCMAATRLNSLTLLYNIIFTNLVKNHTITTARKINKSLALMKNFSTSIIKTNLRTL